MVEVPYTAEYNVFAVDTQHSKQPECINNTCVVETGDSNVILDSPNMCDSDIQNDQNVVERDDERVALANLIANLKLDENSKESNSIRVSCLVALQSKHTEFEKYKACNDRTADYDKLKHELESEKAEFSDMYDVIMQDYVSKDVMCSYLQSLSDLDALAELQCMYLYKVKECEYLAQKISKQTDSVSKKVHTEILQRFAKVEKHSISLEIALRNCKEQHKNMAIYELKKLIEQGKAKSVDTKFDRPSVVRQPNDQRIPKPSV
nr:hypothetical protein [Tanacetum cinerariifolium]